MASLLMLNSFLLTLMQVTCCLKVSLLSLRTPSNLKLSVTATSFDPTLIFFLLFHLVQQSSDNTQESRRNLCAEQGR